MDPKSTKSLPERRNFTVGVLVLPAADFCNRGFGRKHFWVIVPAESRTRGENANYEDANYEDRI